MFIEYYVSYITLILVSCTVDYPHFHIEERMVQDTFIIEENALQRYDYLLYFGQEPKLDSLKFDI